MSRNPVVLLLGLDASLAAELGNIASDFCGSVHHRPWTCDSDCAGALESINPDLVFCPTEGKRYEVLLSFIRLRRPGVPVIVVSRLPEVNDWIDALESGASDYCASPFEASDLRWILDRNLQAQRLTSAVAA